MTQLHDCDCEQISGGAPVGNISTTVNTSVGPTTVTSNASIVAKPKITTKAGVANQFNVAVQSLTFAGVNTTFSGTQVNTQVNDLNL